MLYLLLSNCCLIFTINLTLSNKTTVQICVLPGRWHQAAAQPLAGIAQGLPLAHHCVYSDRFSLPATPEISGLTCHFLELLLLIVTFELLVPSPTCITQLQGNPCPKTPWKLILELRSDYLLVLQSKPNAGLRTTPILRFPEGYWN